MMTIARDACLAIAVLTTWLGCLGLLRLHAALDRLHGVAFVNMAGGFLAVAAFIEEGITTRSLKIVAILAVTLLAGAASTHAVGGALRLRDGTER